MLFDFPHILFMVISFSIVAVLEIVFFKYVHNQKTKDTILKISALLTLIIHHSSLWYDFIVNKQAIIEENMLFMIYPCNVAMWFLFIYAFIDYKDNIIPNRLALTVFEIGIIFTVIFGYIDFNIVINNVIGLIVGGAVFGIITLIGKLIVNKEAMGFGDVKLMAALGLVMGFPKILMIAITSFLIGAFISILLLIFKKKKAKDTVPFGPFIVISTIIVMFIPTNILLLALLNIFTLGMYHA